MNCTIIFIPQVSYFILHKGVHGDFQQNYATYICSFGNAFLYQCSWLPIFLYEYVSIGFHIKCILLHITFLTYKIMYGSKVNFDYKFVYKSK